MSNMDLELFKQTFDPDDELSLDPAEVVTEEMQEEWDDVKSKIESLWDCVTEKQIIQLMREIKEQVAQWPG